MQKLLTRTVVRIAIVTIAIVEVKLAIARIPVTVHQVAIGPQLFYIIASVHRLSVSKFSVFLLHWEQCVVYINTYYDAGSFFWQ